MWNPTNCDRCGDCFVECLYVDWDRDKAVEEISSLIDRLRGDRVATGRVEWRDHPSEHASGASMRAPNPSPGPPRAGLPPPPRPHPMRSLLRGAAALLLLAAGLLIGLVDWGRHMAHHRPRQAWRLAGRLAIAVACYMAGIAAGVDGVDLPLVADPQQPVLFVLHARRTSV